MNLIQKLVDRDGYVLGEAWRLSEKSVLAVVPVVRTLKPYGERGYLTVEEAKKDLELTDTGSISALKLLNKTGRPVFVRTGTVFGGVGTQSRAAEGSFMVDPEKVAVEIPVRCVHASQGISPRASFNVTSSSSPPAVDYSLMARTGQGETWSSVQYSAGVTHQFLSRTASARYAMTPQSMISADSLVSSISALQEAGKDIEDIVSKIPVEHTGQVGVCVLDLDGVREFEAFDHPDSWEAVSKSIARKYAPEIDSAGRMAFRLTRESVEEAVTEFLKKAERLAKSGPVKSTGKSSSVWSFRSDEIVGESAELAGEGIHFLAARTRKPAPRQNVYETPFRSTFSPQPSPSLYYTSGSTTQTYPTYMPEPTVGAGFQPSEDLFRRRKHYLHLAKSLEGRESSWGEVSRRMPRVSSRTIDSTLKAGISAGYISKKGDGKKRYSLTAKGQELVEATA